MKDRSQGGNQGDPTIAMSFQVQAMDPIAGAGVLAEQSSLAELRQKDWSGETEMA